MMLKKTGESSKAQKSQTNHRETTNGTKESFPRNGHGDTKKTGRLRANGIGESKPLRNFPLRRENLAGGVPIRGLLNYNTKFTFSNVVIQALATALDPSWLELMLGPNHIGKFRELPTRRTCLELINKLDHMAREHMSSTAELLYVLKSLRDLKPGLEPLNPFPLQRYISRLNEKAMRGEKVKNLYRESSKSEAEPAEWLREVLMCLEKGEVYGQYQKFLEPYTTEKRKPRSKEYATTRGKNLIRDMFVVKWEDTVQCRSSRTSLPATSTIENGEDWILTLNPGFDRNRSGSEDMITLTSLLQHRNGDYMANSSKCSICKDNCGYKRTSRLSHLPDHLIVHFRGFPPVDHVDVEDEIDLADFSTKFSGINGTMYELESIINTGRSITEGKFVVYTNTLERTEAAPGYVDNSWDPEKDTEERWEPVESTDRRLEVDGKERRKWWCCKDESVTEVKHGLRDKFEGHAHLAFYRKHFHVPRVFR